MVEINLSYSEVIFKMDSGILYEIFILPITFKTVSFHHRSNYEIKMFPAERHPLKSLSIRPDFSVTRKEVDKKTGNIMGVGASVTQQGTLVTDRFPIDYNEQSINFTTGLWLQVNLNAEQQSFPIKIELYRLDVEVVKDGKVQRIENPQSKKVAEELLYVTLSRSKDAVGRDYHFRKLIFPACEYISFIELGCVSIDMGKKIEFSRIHYDEEHRQLFIQQSTLINCCLARKRIVDSESFLAEIYQIAVRQKLKVYELVSNTLKEKIKEYKIRMQTKRYSLKTSKKWSDRWVRAHIPNLRYLQVNQHERGEQGLLDSCMPMNNQGTLQLSFLLCYHYDCHPHQLATYIAGESWLIEKNIQAAFQRIIQILAALAEGAAFEIAANQKRRVSEFLAVGGDGKGYSAEMGITEPDFLEYTNKINYVLQNLPNFSILQKKQPLLMVSGDKPIGKRIDITKTVTILVHGYRGNEFDLSKLKSYLNLFLGFTHFYAVRSIGPGEGTDAGINKLGELAGEEVNKYLSANIGIKYVNVVGFSLGGVIARSMLPHLTAHQHKFNLLLTLASPHLGIIEVSSCLVRTGLFYMRRVAKVESIQDLNNERTTDRSRYLQELANCPLITAFRWVILVGSNQDDYVPSYSSLCSYSGDDERIKRLSDSFNERVCVIRCNVRIEVEESLMDKLTRRRTHISLLEDDSFIRMLVVRFQHYFTHTR